MRQILTAQTQQRMAVNAKKAAMLRVQMTAWTRRRAKSFHGVSVNGVWLLHNSFLYTFLFTVIVRPALPFPPLHTNLERRDPCVRVSLLARCVFRVVDFVQDVLLIPLCHFGTNDLIAEFCLPFHGFRNCVIRCFIAWGTNPDGDGCDLQRDVM